MFLVASIVPGTQWLLIKCCCCCSVTKSCLTLCNPMDCSTPGFPVLHHLLEFAQIHVHWVGGAIQPSHPLLPSCPFAFNLPSTKVFSNEALLFNMGHNYSVYLLDLSWGDGPCRIVPPRKQSVLVCLSDLLSVCTHNHKALSWVGFFFFNKVK